MSDDALPPMIGVLVAAGRGRRLGGSKQLRPWTDASGTRPLVGAAFDAVAGVCASMIVVVDHDAAAVVDALGERRFRTVGGRADAEMFESVRAGLEAARQRDPNAAILLQPADHPHVAPATLVALGRAHVENPEQAVIPQYRGRGGHPVIIPGALADRLIAARPVGGLGRFWRDHPDLCVRLPVDDASVRRDLDRPEDLPKDDATPDDRR